MTLKGKTNTCKRLPGHEILASCLIKVGFKTSPVSSDLLKTFKVVLKAAWPALNPLSYRGHNILTQLELIGYLYTEKKDIKIKIHNISRVMVLVTFCVLHGYGTRGLDMSCPITLPNSLNC